MPDSRSDVAARLQDQLLGAGWTFATAESLTGGLVGATVTAVPGSSAVYLGGVVSYATSVKLDLLGVPAEVVERYGVVSTQCAEAMAERVRALTGATYGLATTGVAGPELQEGRPAGTVHIGLAGPSGTGSRTFVLDGDRARVRAAAVEAALSALSEHASSDAQRCGPEVPGLG